MHKMKWMLPLVLAGSVIGGALGFTRYFNAYERPGEHWAPASPIAHETARFMADMGAPGDYRVQVEKLSSKFPLLFVEYQPPGPLLDASVHSDDGIVRLDQQFADEGQYKISVQHTIHPNHREDINFTVQTPLSKYAMDVFLFVVLLIAGAVSGRRLRELFALCLIVAGSFGMAPDQAMAHGLGGEHQPHPLNARVDDVAMIWATGSVPHGPANRSPLDWSIRITKGDKPARHGIYDLDIIHLESGLPVLHLEGVASNGLIPLKYSPPDATDYRLQLRTAVDSRVYHLALEAVADAIRPAPMRQWKSFILLMIPVFIGMIWGWGMPWGWRRGAHG